MKRTSLALASALLVVAALVFLAPLALDWIFFSGRAWPRMHLEGLQTAAVVLFAAVQLATVACQEQDWLAGTPAGDVLRERLGDEPEPQDYAADPRRLPAQTLPGFRLEMKKAGSAPIVDFPVTRGPAADEPHAESAEGAELDSHAESAEGAEP